MGSRHADHELSLALTPAAGPAGWQPVLAALAVHRPGPAAAEALIDLLPIAENQTSHDLARALGPGLDDARVERLIKLLRDETQPVLLRSNAALCLGHRRTLRVAEALVDHTGPDQREKIQQAAVLALGTLTGVERPAATNWTQWWQQHHRLSDAQWQALLIENFARRDDVRRHQQQLVEQRLNENHRTLYRTAAAGDRPAVLIRMLADPLDAVRLQAVELAMQRLLDDAGFDEKLRQALRDRLDDPAPEIRQRVTLLLRDIADEPAADLVARRLAHGQETSVTVLRWSMLLMARMPRTQAIPAALTLLQHPSVRGDAAAALAAAHEAGLLRPKQASRALKTVRSQLDQTGAAPQLLALLSRIGEDDDWKRIAEWLHSSDRPLKEAAAKAWAASSQPLTPLAEMADDPVIQPVLFLAAAQRGRDVHTFRAVVLHPPADGAVVQNWQRAVLAMSERVSERVVLAAARELVKLDQPVQLAEQMITASLQREDATASEQITAELLVERARLRLIAGEHAQAVADYEHIAKLKARFPVRQTIAIARRRVQAYLLMNDVDKAMDLARQLFQPADLAAEWSRHTDLAAVSTADDPVGVVDLFLAAAQRHALAGRTEPASRILSQLRHWLQPIMQPSLDQRIALVEAQVAGATTPASAIATSATADQAQGQASPPAVTAKPAPAPAAQ